MDRPIRIARAAWLEFVRSTNGHLRMDRFRIEDIAEPIIAKAAWSDLLLPESELELHDQIVAVADQPDPDLDRSGSGGHRPLRLGCSVLFVGASGADKTVAAGAMASALGRDLFRGDLASVASKYIGETEKNCARRSIIPNGPAPSCFSTRPTRCLARARRSGMLTIAMPISKSRCPGLGWCRSNDPSVGDRIPADEPSDSAPSKRNRD
jgi:hypothetical protein